MVLDIGWSLVLNGVSVVGGNDAPSGTTNAGCLPAAPDGLGVPGLRTEDVTYPQRDGVVHFFDWYEPRIITAQGVMICPDGCPGCPTARARVAALMGAWSRHCDDGELVIFTDCHDPNPDLDGASRGLIGPYGVAGRPRVATTQWIPGTKCATATLRFDGVDHRLFILDAEGTPGSGTQCVDLSPIIAARCRTYPRCYEPTMCYTVENPSVTGVGPQDTDNFGTLCAPYTIVLTGPLSAPTVENVTTGESITYTGSIGDGETVTINTDTGTAIDSNGISRTYLLTGATRSQMAVGVNVIRLTAQGGSGTAQACYRPAVLTG